MLKVTPKKTGRLRRTRKKYKATRATGLSIALEFNAEDPKAVPSTPRPSTKTPAPGTGPRPGTGPKYLEKPHKARAGFFTARLIPVVTRLVKERT